VPPRPKYTKPDENQAEIAAGLAAIGHHVWDVHNVLETPDIFTWGYNARLDMWLVRGVEIKTEDGDLTPGQERFMERWPGAILVARTLDEVLADFGQNRSRT